MKTFRPLILIIQSSLSWPDSDNNWLDSDNNSIEMATKTKRARTHSAEVNNEVCAICCSEIIEGREEALLCEGKGTCSRWMHRYCAGVTEAHYESFEKSPLPFNCSLCVQKSQVALIEELKSACHC